MSLVILISSALFLFSIFGIFSVFLLNPLMARLSRAPQRREPTGPSTPKPSVSLIIVAHNPGALAREKMLNSLSLNYPPDRYDIVFFSDGSTDNTRQEIEAFHDPRVRFSATQTHEGKNSGLNRAVRVSTGEVLAFTDVDAILDPDAVTHLVGHFADPSVGGVCGKREISEGHTRMAQSQNDYISFDTSIKLIESRNRSISSNDGKLYAIRRDLFQEIPPAVTDDLYVALSVVKQNRRFVFEPRAKAWIRTPSRSAFHEIQRRRRIVSTSLRGIFLMRGVLNPLRYGLFSVNLFVNKVMRRLLPLFLILLLVSTAVLSFHSIFFRIILGLQGLFYLLALLYPLFFRSMRSRSIITRVSSLAFYFCIGNYGTLLGLLDFLRGKEISKWEPLKSDAQAA